MAYQIIQEDESLPEKSLTIVLYGDPGTGKTSLSFTAEKPLLFDFDKGVHRAVGRKATVKFANWQDTQNFIKDGELERFAPKTLVNDTGGALLDDFIAGHVVKQNSKNGKPGGGVGLQGFGAMKDVFNMFVNDRIEAGVDLIFVCHSSEKADGDNMRLRPKMTGGSYDILLAKADLVGYVCMENNAITVNFNPTDRHVGKNCAEFPKIVLPHYESAEWPGFMGRLIQQAKGKINAMSEAQRAAVEKVQVLSEQILTATDEDALLAIYQELAPLSGIYRAQVMPTLLKRHAEVWDAEYIELAETAEDLNKLIEAAKQLPQELQVIKSALVKGAQKKGFILAGGKENPHFLLNPAAVPKPKPSPEPEPEPEPEAPAAPAGKKAPATSKAPAAGSPLFENQTAGA